MRRPSGRAASPPSCERDSPTRARSRRCRAGRCLARATPPGWRARARTAASTIEQPGLPAPTLHLASTAGSLVFPDRYVRYTARSAASRIPFAARSPHWQASPMPAGGAAAQSAREAGWGWRRTDSCRLAAERHHHQRPPAARGHSVASVAHPVSVRVGWPGFGPPGTVVHPAAHAVAVDVVGRIVRARVAGVAELVAVAVGLRRVRHRRAVVAGSRAGRRCRGRQRVARRRRRKAEHLDPVIERVGHVQEVAARGERHVGREDEVPQAAAEPPRLAMKLPSGASSWMRWLLAVGDEDVDRPRRTASHARGCGRGTGRCPRQESRTWRPGRAEVRVKRRIVAR